MHVWRALRRGLGNFIWSESGVRAFCDAFSLDDRWFATSYIAIDQGPIVVMIADWRSGLLRDCFMRNEDVQTGLTGLGFSTSSSEACLDLLPELDLSIPPQSRSFFSRR